MTDATEMPKYDGMEYEELVVAAQFLWMENAKLRKQISELKKLVWQYNSALNCLLKTGICTRQCVACWTFMDPAWLENRMRELGIEADA